MINPLPVDTTSDYALRLVATGTVAPVVKWGPDPAGTVRDGKVQNVEIGQETDDNGVPFWLIDCNAKTGKVADRVRTETISVRVPAAVRPVVGEYEPITFRGLRVSTRRDGNTNRVTGTWDAD